MYDDETKSQCEEKRPLIACLRAANGESALFFPFRSGVSLMALAEQASTLSKLLIVNRGRSAYGSGIHGPGCQPLYSRCKDIEE
jgi:hypothetical protein